LADDLAAGRLDVALIPSIEYFKNPGYTIVSDACIGCRGPVLSVKLFCRTPVERIRTLALDEGSRTSAALVRILLDRQFGLSPRLVPLPIGDSIDDSSADAVLLIGDRAMHPPAGRYADVWDLGDAWRRWSKLPFVFAMWVARSGVDLAGLDLTEVGQALAAARDLGVAHVDDIAAREAAPLGLSRPQCVAYLRDNLHFFLGRRERQGLRLFYRHAAELGLAPRGLDLGRADRQLA
jgi:chorismate dehydratase